MLTQKDVLKGIGRLGPSSEDVVVTECMSLNVPTVSPETPIYDVSQFMDTTRLKWLPVLRDQQLVGLVTQSDVTRALTSLVRTTEVSAIMSQEVATVDAAMTVSQASDLMIEKDISCVIAQHKNTIAGILTEKDVLGKVVATNMDPNAILVADVMSPSVVSVPPFCSLFSAYGIMERERLHRLVVMEGKQLCGIITQTDILRAMKTSLFKAGTDMIAG